MRKICTVFVWFTVYGRVFASLFSFLARRGIASFKKPESLDLDPDWFTGDVQDMCFREGDYKYLQGHVHRTLRSHPTHLKKNMLQPCDVTCSPRPLEGCFFGNPSVSFFPMKKTHKKHRFELSILNFWAPRNLIRNIVPLILKSLGSQRSNHQHQHLKVSVFHSIFDHFQYFPIHFWDDLRIPDFGESYLLCKPALVVQSFSFA